MSGAAANSVTTSRLSADTGVSGGFGCAEAVVQMTHKAIRVAKRFTVISFDTEPPPCATEDGPSGAKRNSFLPPGGPASVAQGGSPVFGDVLGVRNRRHGYNLP